VSNIPASESSHLRPWRQLVSSIALRLIEPAGSLQEAEARLSARLLAALLLALVCLDLVGALAISMTTYPASTAVLLWGAAVPPLLHPESRGNRPGIGH
jgi:hypothetical protein